MITICALFVLPVIEAYIDVSLLYNKEHVFLPAVHTII
jgi:hypothetical protein